MSKLLPIILASTLVFATGDSLAKTAHKTASKSSEKKHHTAKAPSINLYSGPSSHAKVLEKVKHVGNLVPIFTKGSWVKVGDSTNGRTGWVKQSDIDAAVKAVKQSIHATILEQAQNLPDSNNQVYKIIQYSSDGNKPLTKAEATQLINRIHQQEQNMMAQQARMQQAINQMQAQTFGQAGPWGGNPYNQFGGAMPPGMQSMFNHPYPSSVIVIADPNQVKQFEAAMAQRGNGAVPQGNNPQVSGNASGNSNNAGNSNTNNSASAQQPQSTSTSTSNTSNNTTTQSNKKTSSAEDWWKNVMDNG